ncbi:MAG: stage III sporulation protein AC, partial [Lachnospiraceae bacterium]|nr:stage III sporulation protein AC [Lachnospiraceae bacterium]
AVGILITLLNQILKHSGREDQAFLLSLAGIVMVLIWIIPYIVEMFTLVQGLFEL